MLKPMDHGCYVFHLAEIAVLAKCSGTLHGLSRTTVPASAEMSSLCAACASGTLKGPPLIQRVFGWSFWVVGETS